MRTSKRNALISFIPVYGLSSYFYLGKKLGFKAWLICLGIGFLPLVTSIIPVHQNILLDAILLIIFLIISFVLQYFIVSHFTKLKNKEVVEN